MDRYNLHVTVQAFHSWRRGYTAACLKGLAHIGLAYALMGVWAAALKPVWLARLYAIVFEPVEPVASVEPVELSLVLNWWLNQFRVGPATDE